ncbi:HAD family hydrolase [Pseudocolwellia sp. HL-MZ7]|uniref:HAD family hydrolase n=1 Tax=Pseudocolwellia sp. HL-MZ7 TaxID=3400627 RepID=UPI003CEB9CCB
MIKVYLFDWGDTLMIDFPGVTGKMCDWKVVEAVSGAKETLEALSKYSRVYIATGAADSTELEVKKAFERVGLNQFISGYFCKANVGFSKGTPKFLNAILKSLQITSVNVAMVGDNFDKDIKPAMSAGIQSFWFTDKAIESMPDKVKVIRKLTQLYL